jgi:hypothetical protein
VPSRVILTCGHGATRMPPAQVAQAQTSLPPSSSAYARFVMAIAAALHLPRPDRRAIAALQAAKFAGNSSFSAVSSRGEILVKRSGRRRSVRWRKARPGHAPHAAVARHLDDARPRSADARPLLAAKRAQGLAAPYLQVVVADAEPQRLSAADCSPRTRRPCRPGSRGCLSCLASRDTARVLRDDLSHQD